MPIRTVGLDELYKALAEVEPELHGAVQDGLRETGDVVRDDSQERFAEYDAASAAGFRTRVRAAGRVVVEQSRRKTTGRHPRFGDLMVRKGFLPAYFAKENEMQVIFDRQVAGVLRAAGF